MSPRPRDAATLDAERTIAAIEAQLAAGQDVVRIADLGVLRRSYAWAIARSIRLALDAGGTFDTPEQDADGTWWATIRVNLGRQPA